MKKKQNIIKKILYIIIALIILIIAGYIYLLIITDIEEPKIENREILNKERIKNSENFYKLNNSWLKLNKYGLWELYVEGDSFERGVTIGRLTKELIRKQEEAFIEQLKVFVPSNIYINFLKVFIAYFNKDMNKYIPDEYLKEIYGISFSADDEFSYVGPAYQRILNYHAAHDIGHALSNLSMVAVGCTSFSTWGDKSLNNDLIMGRNFDFYIGDKFADDKIIAFYKPKTGYKFMMITWGGMTGVVSGMNDKGIAITINAAKSNVPTSTKTPISILVREILQYSNNIYTAINIAKKRELFISESIMIASKEDNKTIIIEKTPDTIDVFTSDKNFIISTNHFQSKLLYNSERNTENIAEGSSVYRYERTNQLLENCSKNNIQYSAKILRDIYGIDDKNIGLGNEKAINQLISHHSIMFIPNKLQVWVSTKPYQLGTYVCYDLNNVFAEAPYMNKDTIVYEEVLNIQEDTLLLNHQYKDYEKYRSMNKIIKQCIKDKKYIKDEYLNEFIKYNPEYYNTYSTIGDYYNSISNEKALYYYRIALEKEIPNKSEVKNINDKIKDIKGK